VVAVAQLQVSRIPKASVPQEGSRQDALYNEFGTALAGAVERLARGYEANDARRQDLVQEIHVALWRSFANFDGRCSLRTWVYRVAHNVAVSHVLRDRRGGVKELVGLEEIGNLADPVRMDQLVEQRQALDRLLELVRSLNPTDRQVILLYLEGEDAVGIGEVTGLSAPNVATKIHRIKKVLTSRFQGGSHG
jgi:RNA polymerase sigma-70 factor, ECF subfamily